jgi:hypothetical protein
MKGVPDHVQPRVLYVTVDLAEGRLLEAHLDGYIDLARRYVFGQIVTCTMAVDFHDLAIPALKTQLRVDDPQIAALAPEA